MKFSTTLYAKFLAFCIVFVSHAAAQDETKNAYKVGNDALLAGLTPAGWQQPGKIEHYGVRDLYVKINGRSEMYMSYDVVGLSFVSYSNIANPGHFIDVFTYDMQTPTGAFGVYAVEREPEQPKIDIGREGYHSDSNIYFWKGQYYVYVQASNSDDASQSAALAVARGVAGRLTDMGGEVEGIDSLPTQGLLTNTIQYFKADAMSLDFMNETYTGKYELGSLTVTFFVSDRASEEEAESIRSQFVEYMEDYGEDVTKTTVDGVEITVGDLGGGYYDAVFRTGATVAGLTGLRGKDLSIETAKKELALLQAHHNAAKK